VHQRQIGLSGTSASGAAGTKLAPPLSDIEISEVFRWLGKVGFQSGLPTTRIQRALAAYTHVIGLPADRQGEVLFRAMQGLEAFYCDGNGDLRRQLGEKAATWLGPWQTKKNIVGHLYDSRSKFVHGAGHLDYWNRQEDLGEENDDKLAEFSAVVTFSVRLLIATLQKCVQSGVTNYRWRYTMEILG
jgi:hypothetical protein